MPNGKSCSRVDRPSRMLWQPVSGPGATMCDECGRGRLGDCDLVDEEDYDGPEGWFDSPQLDGLPDLLEGDDA